MEQRIVGTTMPVLEITLNPGEHVVAESGELSWITDSIELKTTTATAGSTGFFGALKRALGGGSFFMTEYSAQGVPGMVAFASKLPGQIMAVQVTPGQAYLVQRGGFLCATPGINVSVGFHQTLGAGIFGGNGFVLQKLEGNATAWVELSGEVVPYDLVPGQSLRVHPGHVGMFEGSVKFDITTVRGIKNVLFGGDGLFLAQLTGPGKVWLQSLPIAKFAHALLPYLPQPRESGGGGVSINLGDNS